MFWSPRRHGVHGAPCDWGIRRIKIHDIHARAMFNIGLYRDVWIAAIASSTTSLATRTAAIYVFVFRGDVYVA